MPRSISFSVSLTGLSASLLMLLAACGSSVSAPAGRASEPAQLLDAQAVGFYADPNSTPATWVKNHPNDSRTSLIRSKISTQASGRWFGGWSGDITPAVRGFATAAASAGKTPILVAYNIPGRDCGQYSAGGAASDAAYKTWISNFAKAIGSRAAVVVLEPDALSQLKDCLSGTQQTARLSLIRYAVDQFADNARNTKLYLDAGHNNWIAPAEMASRLKSANIARARGFALNTSNFGTTANNTTYGNNIVNALGSAKRFVIDTSRNGNGWNGQWCNPGGRKLGSVSKVVAGNSGLEMLLRVKTPGESDGNCGVGSGSKAGDFLPQVAYDMAK